MQFHQLDSSTQILYLHLVYRLLRGWFWRWWPCSSQWSNFEYLKCHEDLNGRTEVKSFGILDEANDWKIDSDLPEFQRETNKFVFPFWICPTDLKPDCVIFSMERKICIIVEVTAPMDVNIDKWHSIKLEKYQVGIQQEADKNTNNRDDNQKFDEREPRRLPRFLRLHLFPFIRKVEWWLAGKNRAGWFVDIEIQSQ